MTDEMRIIANSIAIAGWCYMAAKSLRWKQLEATDRFVATVGFACLAMDALNSVLKAWK